MVRSDFKEVYRLKVWNKKGDFDYEARARLEAEAKLMITIQR